MDIEQIINAKSIYDILITCTTQSTQQKLMHL